RPAMSVAPEAPSSARIVVTATGCVMYGSPLLRFCPVWYLSATAKARSIAAKSSWGLLALTVLNKGTRTGDTGLILLAAEESPAFTVGSALSAAGTAAVFGKARRSGVLVDAEMTRWVP